MLWVLLVPVGAAVGSLQLRPAAPEERKEGKERTRGRGDSDIAGCPASAAQTEWRQAALLAG